MALDFSVSGSRLNHGTGSSLADLTAGTFLAWAYMPSITAAGGNSRLYTKGLAASGLQSFQIGSTGNITFEQQRNTTYLQISTQSLFLPTLGDNKWFLIAASWDVALTSADQYFYHGDLATLAAVVTTYNINRAVGSGASSSNAAEAMHVGNHPSTNLHFRGRIGAVGYFNRQLSLAEIRLWQRQPQALPGCRLLVWPGYGGLGSQADLSGNRNTGTISGGTALADHVPVTPAWRPGRAGIAYAPTAAGGPRHALAAALSGEGTLSADLALRAGARHAIAAALSGEGTMAAALLVRAAQRYGVSAVLSGVATMTANLTLTGAVADLFVARGLLTVTDAARAVLRARDAARGRITGD